MLGACLWGTGAELISVEARLERHPKERTEVLISGLPDPVIRESRGRITCALEANGLHLPGGKLYLNLVPAGRRKAGEMLDLPLLLGAAAAAGHLPAGALDGALFLGELGIDGALHAGPGGLAAALAGARHGIERLFAPRATATEAMWVRGIAAHGAQHLRELLLHLCGGPVLLPLPAQVDEEAESAWSAPPEGPSLDEVRGQELAKYALAVAAAGGHGLLLIGPPGGGKSMLARRLPSILPPPGRDERLEITRVLSVLGRWPGGLARARPFRAPHHTVSYAGLVGGGSPPVAGEVTLAHGGVLFLDELPEFRREVLEALRQPMESGDMQISRKGRQVELPARFQLVAAMNPCPCGYQGHPRVPCRCSPGQVQRYRGRVSGPLLDRIELRVEVQPPTLEELAPTAASPHAHAEGPGSAARWRAAVVRAREAQLQRQGARQVARVHLLDLLQVRHAARHAPQGLERAR